MRDLTMNEVEEVAGGPFWKPIMVAFAKCSSSNACKGAVAAAGAAVGAAVGYENNRVDDSQGSSE